MGPIIFFFSVLIYYIIPTSVFFTCQNCIFPKPDKFQVEQALYNEINFDSENIENLDEDVISESLSNSSPRSISSQERLIPVEIETRQ